MDTPLSRRVRAALTAQDGVAFVDRSRDYAPRSGEDCRPGFILLTSRSFVAVASSLPSGYQDRARHMRAFVDVLLGAGFALQVRTTDGRVTAIKVVS